MSKSGSIYYNTFMYPFEKLILGGVRRKLMCKARGNALEIGFGTGVNLKYYDFNKIDSLFMLEKKIIHDIDEVKYNKVKIVEGDAAVLPFDDGIFDTVVFTLVFCSVENPVKGLSEVKRVLRDNGKLIFIEHVKPVGKTSGKIVNWANKPWNSISNGCNLNRDTITSIREAGFDIDNSNFSRKGVFISGTAKKKEDPAPS